MENMMQQAWMQQLWTMFKVVAPWLTGGLAGAILTYFLNQRTARRKQPRLILSILRVDYSIPSKDEQLNDLQVSYGGKSYENLLLYQVDIENVSGRTIGNSPILFALSRSSSIIDKSTIVKPLNRETLWKPQDGQEGAYIWDASELKPGDSARLRLLIAPQTEIQWSWRGDDDVEVVAYGRESERSLETELRNVIAWIAMYLICGAIPFFAGALKALLLVASSPYIIRYLFRFWSLLSQSKRSFSTPIMINNYTHDSGLSTIQMGNVKTSDD